MNEVSITINGVRYDAVMSDFPFSDCHDCAFFVSCTENNSCCNFLGENMQGMIFKKSNKKFVVMKKKYVFNNYFSSESFKRIEVEAETILEAKKKVKEMGYDNMCFIRIKILRYG